MRAEFVTREEMMAQLRDHGLEDCTQAKRTCMEADNIINIIKMKK